MDTTSTKRQLLDRIREERAAWEALLAKVGAERMQQQGAMGDWTFKDLIAHLTAWQERELTRLAAAQRGERPAPPPWPEGLDVDRINQWIYDANKERPLHDILRGSRAIWQRFEELVETLPEQELMQPGRFPWMDGRAVGPAVLHDFVAHFHEEHEPVVRAWLDGLNAP
jgi:hypothetical protein